MSFTSDTERSLKLIAVLEERNITLVLFISSILVFKRLFFYLFSYPAWPKRYLNRTPNMNVIFQNVTSCGAT